MCERHPGRAGAQVEGQGPSFGGERREQRTRARDHGVEGGVLDVLVRAASQLGELSRQLAAPADRIDDDAGILPGGGRNAGDPCDLLGAYLHDAQQVVEVVRDRRRHPAERRQAPVLLGPLRQGVERTPGLDVRRLLHHQGHQIGDGFGEADLGLRPAPGRADVLVTDRPGDLAVPEERGVQDRPDAEGTEVFGRQLGGRRIGRSVVGDDGPASLERLMVARDVGEPEPGTRAMGVVRAPVETGAVQPGTVGVEQPDADALDLERPRDEPRGADEDAIERLLLVHRESRQTQARRLQGCSGMLHEVEGSAFGLPAHVASDPSFR